MKRTNNLKIKKVLYFAAILAAATILTVSCSTGNPDNSGNTNSGNSQDADDSQDSDSGDDMPSYVYTPVDDSDLENMEAQQLTLVMGNGINLGNTFESSAATWNGYNAEPSSYETGWGQPVTTKAMFEAYKAAGFDSVRIPIAWTSTMDWRKGDYKINDDFMARIKEVVGWALDSGLFVMINDHWDYGWWGLFGSDKTKAYKIYDAIWDQVGTEFKDYDYRLIFEAGNEEWGERLNDKVDGVEGTLTVDQQYEMITELGQHFVDKIRAQGSKNAKRFLLIPGYDTGFEPTASEKYIMPEDTTNSVQKLLVSVHYYSPATYCIVSDPNNSWGFTNDWGTDEEVEAQNACFYTMKRFIDEGYGVIIGEYAPAMEQTEGLDTETGDDDVFIRKQNDIKWLTNVLDNSDTYNYCPFLWDCNGYFKKTGNLGFTGDFADVAAVYKNRNYAAEKAGTSNGGKIDYYPGTKVYTAAKVSMAVDGTAVKTSITLNNEVTVNAGQTVVFSFDRPAIAHAYAGHVLRLYNSSGTLICSDPTWCTADTYPGNGAGTITLEYKPTATIKIKSLTLEIADPEGTETTQSAGLEISNVVLLIK